MFCVKCGAENADEVNFCHNCGEDLSRFQKSGADIGVTEKREDLDVNKILVDKIFLADRISELENENRKLKEELNKYRVVKPSAVSMGRNRYIKEKHRENGLVARFKKWYNE